MNNFDDVSEAINQGKDYLQEEGKKALNQGKQVVKQSSKDWWNYVENHPLQTLFFGVIGYFTLKGMFKN